MLYPVRIRVVNVTTQQAEWHKVAYVPAVVTDKGPGWAERSRIRRAAILQRVLYLALRALIGASHLGVHLRGAAVRLLLGFLRILLYLCDQPEERAVLCLKPGQCHHPFSMCDVPVE